MEETINITRFEKVDRDRNATLVGFVTFIFNSQFAFNKVQVHQRRKDGSFYLLYPLEKRENPDPIVCPIDRRVQKMIDSEVNAYLKAQAILS